MLRVTTRAMCMHLTQTHASYTPETKLLWCRWLLCNTHITSVHDTAKGFWGIGLRKSKAEVAERIRDTLHRPDDTWSTKEVHSVRYIKNTVHIWVMYSCMNSINHLNNVVFKLPSCHFSLGSSPAGAGVGLRNITLLHLFSGFFILVLSSFRASDK